MKLVKKKKTSPYSWVNNTRNIIPFCFLVSTYPGGRDGPKILCALGKLFIVILLIQGQLQISKA